MEAAGTDSQRDSSSNTHISLMFVQVEGRAPSLIRFRDGANAWTDEKMWRFQRLKQDYGEQDVKAGQSDLIVRNSGSGSTPVKLAGYIDKMLAPDQDKKKRALYVFDGSFFPESELAKSLSMPSYLSTNLASGIRPLSMPSYLSQNLYRRHALVPGSAQLLSSLPPTW